jgi:hypothetical protein
MVVGFIQYTDFAYPKQNMDCIRVHEWFEDTKGVIVAVGFIGGGTTDLPQGTDNIDYIKVYRGHLAWARFELSTFVVIGRMVVGFIQYTDSVYPFGTFKLFL